MKSDLARCTESRKHTEGLFGEYSGREMGVDVDGTLREPQGQAFRVLKSGLDRGLSILLAAPPAFGKSKLACLLMNIMRDKNRLCIVAAPKLGILRSFKEESKTWDFKKYGRIEKFDFMELHGGSGGSKTRELANMIRCYSEDKEHIVLCAHATLVRMLEELKCEAELWKKCFVVLDEAHHVGHSDTNEDEQESNRLAKLMEMIYDNSVQHMIMTATPDRPDGRTLIPKEHEDKYAVFKICLSQMRCGYSTPLVPDVRISLRCYSSESSKILERMENESTDAKPVIANFEALKEIYWEEYRSNPVPTMIQTPYAVIGNGKSNCEIALELEDFFREKNPALRILNLGGTRKTGRPSLVSTLSERQKLEEYYKLDCESYDWDIVISVAVMDEGMDWPPCARVLVPNITTNTRIFMQRDVGRSCRMHKYKTGKKKELMEVVYLVPCLSGDDDPDDSKALEYWRKCIVRFSLLFMGEDIRGRFDKFPKGLLRLFKSGKSDKAVTRSIMETVIGDYYTAKSVVESMGREWKEEDTGEFLLNHSLLADISDKERVRIYLSLKKSDEGTSVRIMQYCQRKMLSETFEAFWKVLPEAFRKFKIDDCLDERGRLITRLLLPAGVSGDKLKKYWKSWRRKYADQEQYWEEMWGLIGKFREEHGGTWPSEDSEDEGEREIAGWLKYARGHRDVRLAAKKLRETKSED